MDILTVDGKVLHRHGVGIIMLAVDDMDPVKAYVVVADSQLLGFDPLFGIDM